MNITHCILLLYGILTLYAFYLFEQRSIKEHLEVINFNDIKDLTAAARDLQAGRFTVHGNLNIYTPVHIEGTSHLHGHVYGNNSNWTQMNANGVTSGSIHINGDLHSNRMFTNYIKNHGQTAAHDVLFGSPNNRYWLHSVNKAFGFQKGVIRHFFMDGNPAVHKNRICLHRPDGCA